MRASVYIRPLIPIQSQNPAREHPDNLTSSLSVQISDVNQTDIPQHYLACTRFMLDVLARMLQFLWRVCLHIGWHIRYVSAFLRTAYELASGRIDIGNLNQWI